MKFGLADTVIKKMESVFETNPRIEKAVLFGSRAKGNFKEGSDIDLAIKGSDFTFDDLLKLSGKLDDLNLVYKIDLLDYAKISEPDLKDHINRVGMEFYKRKT